MLSILRKNSKNWLVILLVGVGVLGMVFFFGSNTTGRGGENWAAKVEGNMISMTDYIRTYKGYSEFYSKKYGDNLKEFEKMFNLKSVALDNLINVKLNFIIAKENKMSVSNKQIAEKISNDPNFQKDGKFSMDYYKGLLSYNRFTPAGYEQKVREELLIRKLNNFFINSAKASPEEVLAYYKSQNEKVNLYFFKVDKSKFETNISDKDVELFLQKEGKKLVEEYYSNNNKKYQMPEKIRAKHILFKVSDKDTEDVKDVKLKKAKELLKKLNLNNFKEMAKKYSEDKASAINGGDLGYFSKGMMVPEFEKVAFSLDKNEISDIVKTRFGYHIIFVEDIKPSKVIPLSNVKNTIAKAIMKEKNIDKKIEEKLSKVSKLKSIKKIADIFKTELKTTGEFTRSEMFIPKIEKSTISDIFWAFNLDKNIKTRKIGTDTYFFKLKNKDFKNIKIDSEAFNKVKEELLQVKAQENLQKYVENYKKSADITYSGAVLKFINKN
jgi:peptidyl-prolyl cis-trans isomerase D